jgi:hypothetical protein
MRTEAEISGMRDRFHRDLFIAGGEASHCPFTILNWVCDPLVSDLDLATALDECEGQDPADLGVEDVLYTLPDNVALTNLPGVTDYLSRITEHQLTELAAAARRIDRLCKAEIKKRSTPL